MHKFRKLKFAAILVMIFAIFASLLPTPVMADEDNAATAFQEKLLFNTFRLCYSADIMPEGMADGSAGDRSYESILSIFPPSDDELTYDGSPVLNISDRFAVGTGGDSIFSVIQDLNLETFKSSDTQSQCETIFGMLYPKRAPKVEYESELIPETGAHRTRRIGASAEDIDTFLETLGYRDNPDKDLRQPVCAEIMYKLQSDTTFYPYETLAYLCWDDATVFSAENDQTQKGIFSPDNFTLINVSPDIATVRLSEDKSGGGSSAGDQGEFWIDGLGTIDSTYDHVKLDFRYDASDTQKPVKLQSCSMNKMGDGEVRDPETTCFYGPYISHRADGGENSYTVMMRIINDKKTANEIYGGSKFFSIDNWGDAFMAARSALNGKYASASSIYLSFTWQEIFDFYTHYLTSFYGVLVDSTSCTQQADSSRVYTSAGWCKYLGTEIDEEAEVTVFANDTGAASSNVVLTKKVNLKGLLEKMYIIASRENVEGVALSEQGKLIDPMPTLSARRVSILDDRCYINGESLGWVLCPIIEFAHDAMESMYRDIVQGYLTIDTVLLTTTNPEGVNQSGTYQAWSIFVGFANVLMIIFLLVIIFSQVTGVGIDNYGIKKALPKIIIAAVLINLSFIICQLLADLSNILGNSLESFLTDIGDHLTRQTSLQGSYASGEAFRSILKLLLVAGGVTMAATTVSTALTSGPLGLLIPLLVGLLVALAAVLFFFVLLGIRKAAIVMLVAVSPMAFACYMLPNLKQQVFDRWFGLLKAMLLAYPLCGLVMGGSNLASAILMSTGMEENFIFYFINMLLMVVPFFFMPSLIKKSMGALGSITTIASRAVRGRINRGGMQARRWNESRPVNQQRRAIRDDNRKRRWENYMRARYSGGTDGLLTRLPWGIGAGIKRRRDNAYGAAIQSIQERQSKEAMRQALIASGNRVVGDSETKSWLDARKAAAALDNYNNDKFVTGTRFLNGQEVADKKARASRYANAQAQEAYKKRMASVRDKEEKEDAIHSSPLATQTAMQGNLARAAAQQEESMTALLNAGKLKIDGMVGMVDPNNADNMEKAYSQVLTNLTKAEPGSEGYRTAMAQAGALQRAMMANGAGRNKLRQIYREIAGSGDEVHSNIRTAAQNLATAQADALESNGMFDTADMLDDIASGKVTIGKVADGQYFADNIGKLSPANIKNLDDKTLEGYVDYINELYEHPWLNEKHVGEYAERLGQAERFLNEVVKGYRSEQNTSNQKQELTRVLDKLRH